MKKGMLFLITTGCLVLMAALPTFAIEHLPNFPKIKKPIHVVMFDTTILKTESTGDAIQLIPSHITPETMLPLPENGPYIGVFYSGVYDVVKVRVADATLEKLSADRADAHASAEYDTFEAITSDLIQTIYDAAVSDASPAAPAWFKGDASKMLKIIKTTKSTPPAYKTNYGLLSRAQVIELRDYIARKAIYQILPHASIKHMIEPPPPPNPDEELAQIKLNMTMLETLAAIDGFDITKPLLVNDIHELRLMNLDQQKEIDNSEIVIHTDQGNFTLKQYLAFKQYRREHLVLEIAAKAFEEMELRKFLLDGSKDIERLKKEIDDMLRKLRDMKPEENTCPEMVY